MNTVLDEAIIRAELLAKHGEFVSGKSLRLLLGYQSERTYLRAIKEKRPFPVLLIKFEGRKGYFARVREIAHWLSRFPQT